jgi:hypothetical protein
MSVDFTFRKLTLTDAIEIQNLALNNDGNKDLTESIIEHWYFKNPSGSNSLWKVILDEKIEGYATTNNFRYNINEKDCWVALPQNVLTSTKIRGKGAFGKLYFKTEIENIEENKVDYFLTMTGAMSTPIFLNKFGYLRGRSPSLLMKFFTPTLLFSKKKYKKTEDLNSIIYTTNFSFNNSRQKSFEYFMWRYGNCTKKNLKLISIFEKEELIGYAFLIVKKKFGIKFLILADIICEKKENVPLVIDACHVYATKSFFPFMTMFEISCNCKKSGINLVLKNRFNFLVKGKTKEDTEMLSSLNFNFFLGDLDYFW